MTDAIKGTYANFRLVKSRGICVIEVEVPVEASKHALDILGGMPVFGQDTWVAIARLREPVQADKPIPAIEAPEKVKQPLRASALAAMMGKEPAFWKYLTEQGLATIDEGEALARLRHLCGFQSRTQLDEAANFGTIQRFNQLRDKYLAWRAVG